jgi:mannose-6-phosphate isomerase-like protein (cupin superfamily)
MSKVINPSAVANALTEYWSPKIVGEVDDSYVKVAKLKGEFTWHAHDGEDEMFLVLSGALRIEIENQDTVELKPGDMYVVKKGVQHNPIADEECQVLLFERKSTLHTGDVASQLSKSIEQQLCE